jgi:hypothetical protein
LKDQAQVRHGALLIADAFEDESLAIWRPAGPQTFRQFAQDPAAPSDWPPIVKKGVQWTDPLCPDRQARRAHWFGIGRFGGGASVMVVLQLRHENVSNCALCSSDLLLSIAMPQSGQCRSGGRG